MYCGLGKLREALAPGSWTDASAPPAGAALTQTAADLSNAQLTDSICEADSIIDAAIGSRYATPVAAIDPGDPGADPPVAPSFPHPIDYWSRTIAAYLATCVFRKGQDFSNDDPIYRRFLVTMKALDSVASGTYALSIPPATTGGGGGPGVGIVINPGQVDFTASDALLGDSLGDGWSWRPGYLMRVDAEPVWQLSVAAVNRLLGIGS